MIEVTLLTGDKITINCDHILEVSTIGPETLLRFTNDNRLRIKESTETIVDMILDWQRKRWMPLV